MPAIRLTDTAITAATRRAAADGKRVEVSDATLPGLRLRITPSGVRTWILGGRDADGRPRRFQIGRYPEVGVSAARDAARSLRQRVRQDGADPIADARKRRKAAQDAAAGVGTLTALVDAYGRQHGERIAAWRSRVLRIKLVFAEHMDRPLASLRRADLQLTADGWRSPQSARGAVSYLRPVLKWGAQRELCPDDVTRIVAPTTVRRRDRVLDRDELARLLPALRDGDGPYPAAALMMLLCATRCGETCAARWRDMDMAAGVWTIPAANSKNGVVHVVPLSRQAAALLARLGPGRPDALIFTRSTARDGVDDAKPLGNWDRAAKELMIASRTAAWTRHDLRRTAATMMARLGAAPHVVESALGHVAIHSRLASIYNSHRYGAEVAAALQLLADALDGIASGAAQVVPLRRPAA